MFVKILLTVMGIGLREQVRDGSHPGTSKMIRLRGHGEESQLTAGTVEEGPPGRHCSLRGMKLLTDALSKQRVTGKKYSDLSSASASYQANPNSSQHDWGAQEMKSLVICLLKHRQKRAKNGWGKGSKEKGGCRLHTLDQFLF